MDEREYERLAGETFQRVLDMFEDVDPDAIDVEQAGDVITMQCPGGQRIVLNTQRPARQLWLAGRERAWHFSFDPESRQWRDDKRPELELFASLAELAQSLAGVRLDTGSQSGM